jgi:DME family drug/metabolite transporter
MAAMFGLAALVLLPSLAITGDNLLTTPIHASVALYMAVVPMFIGYLCFSRGLRQVEASTATLITLLEPVVAVMLAVLIVGERFMPVGWLGVMLIMLSLLLQTVKRRPGGIKSR